MKSERQLEFEREYDKQMVGLVFGNMTGQATLRNRRKRARRHARGVK